VGRLLFASLLLVWSCVPALAELSVKMAVIRELQDRETISILDVPKASPAKMGLSDCRDRAAAIHHMEPKHDLDLPGNHRNLRWHGNHELRIGGSLIVQRNACLRRRSTGVSPHPATADRRLR
jgi:hypothetical protein